MTDIFIAPTPSIDDLDKLSLTVTAAFPRSHGYIKDVLSRGERARLHSASALLLLAHALGKFGIDTAQISIERAPSGKPYFENCDMFFSLSHDTQAIAAALSGTDIGIDIQSPCKADEKKLYKRFFGSAAQGSEEFDTNSFYTEWTQKEALCKLCDIPLAQALREPLRDGVFLNTFKKGDVTISLASMINDWITIHEIESLDLCM